MLCREEIEDKGGKVGVHNFRSWGTAVAFCLVVLLMSNSRGWEKSGHVPRYEGFIFQRLTMGCVSGKYQRSSFSFYVWKPRHSL